MRSIPAARIYIFANASLPLSRSPGQSSLRSCTSSFLGAKSKNFNLSTVKPTMADRVSRVEAPVTGKAYFLCAFAAFGGILFGYDSGYISSCLGMDFFKYQFGSEVPADYDPTSFERGGTFYMYKTWEKSLITSILSAGTFLGALCAGNFADWIGRRTTIILGCLIFSIGVVLQVAATIVGLLVAGRFVAGLGVGFVSAIIILYMSEIAPKAVRGTVSIVPTFENSLEVQRM